MFLILPFSLLLIWIMVWMIEVFVLAIDGDCDAGKFSSRFRYLQPQIRVQPWRNGENHRLKVKSWRLVEFWAFALYRGLDGE